MVAKEIWGPETIQIWSEFGGRRRFAIEYPNGADGAAPSIGKRGRIVGWHMIIPNLSVFAYVA
jgi:hypothetical protein